MSTKSQIQEAQEYVLENLSKDLSVDALALRAGMSTRNFSRVFRRDLKYTPAAFVDAARIDAARRMLADTKTPLQRVARACGFGNVNSMRRVFVRNLGVSPHDYRKSFRSAYSDMDVTPKTPRRPNAGEAAKPFQGTARQPLWPERAGAGQVGVLSGAPPSGALRSVGARSAGPSLRSSRRGHEAVTASECESTTSVDVPATGGLTVAAL
jgi:AraC-like DNA-binding protein